MNWKQLHASATPEERLDLLLHMMQTIEARQHRIVFTGQKWVRNRRQGYQAHFLNDRRSRRHNLKRAASLITFGAVWLVVSTATAAAWVNAPPHIGGPVMFFYATSMLGVVIFKPAKKATSPLRI